MNRPNRLGFVIAALVHLPFCSAPAAEGPAATVSLPATGTISGRVQNIVTGVFLSRARVAIKGTDRVAYTDEFGTYRLVDVPAGPVVLEVFHTGLDAQEISLQLPAQSGIEQDVALSNKARYGLDPSVV